MQIQLTQKEEKILDYLKSKNNQKVAYEELAQFATDPTKVKKKTITNTVTGLKKKFKDANLNIPFDVTFVSLLDTKPEVKPAQVLIEVKRTPAGTIIPANTDKHVAQIDFSPDKDGYRRVITKYGKHNLNDSEWEMFKYFYNNPGKVIPLSELRDKVTFYKYPVSKLPARWFDSIQRIINNMRKAVPNLDKRLLTVKGQETGYIFQ